MALAVAAALLLLGNFWLYETRDVVFGGRVPPDFRAYHLAGEVFGRGLNPYLDHSAAHPDLARAAGWNPGYSSFLYPPTFLPVYALVARLDVKIAARTWTGLSLLLLAGAALTAALDRGRNSVRVALVTLLLALLSRPLVVHVQRGEIDLALASIAVIALVAYRRDYRWAAAVLLAIVALAKIGPAVLLISFVVPCRDWGFATRFAGSGWGVASCRLSDVIWLLRDGHLAVVECRRDVVSESDADQVCCQRRSGHGLLDDLGRVGRVHLVGGAIFPSHVEIAVFACVATFLG